MYWTGFLQLSFYHSKLRFFLVRWASERNDMTRKKLDGGSKTCDISGSLRGPTVVVFSQLYLLWFWFDKVLKLNNIDSCCSLVCLQISISYWSCERIDQFRCIKIQPETMDISTRLWVIKPTNSVVIPRSLALMINFNISKLVLSCIHARLQALLLERHAWISLASWN